MLTQFKTLLETMSLKEMKEAKLMLAAAIKEKEIAEKERFLAQIQEQAKTLGLELDEVLGKHVQTPTVLTLPRYINPDNPSETWHGIGKQPDWLRRKIKQGHRRHDFLSENLSEEQIRKIAAALAEK